MTRSFTFPLRMGAHLFIVALWSPASNAKQRAGWAKAGWRSIFLPGERFHAPLCATGALAPHHTPKRQEDEGKKISFSVLRFFRWNELGGFFALEARMKVAGGKLGETKRTHRIGWQCARAPAGRMRWAVDTFVMRPAGAPDCFYGVTGGCGSPYGRVFPPATFTGPAGAGASGNG